MKIGFSLAFLFCVSILPAHIAFFFNFFKINFFLKMKLNATEEIMLCHGNEKADNNDKTAVDKEKWSHA